MALPPDIGDRENKVFCKFTLQSEVVLLSILRPGILGRLTKQQNRTEALPIHRLTARRVQEAIEWVGEGGSSILPEERRIELRVEDEAAAAKRRLGAKLLQNELFDRIVENAVARSNAALPRTAEQLAEKAVL